MWIYKYRYEYISIYLYLSIYIYIITDLGDSDARGLAQYLGCDSLERDYICTPIYRYKCRNIEMCINI